MAIVSGPGTTSVSSAGFTGPAEALEIVGDHAYAASGSQTVTNTDKTLFEFKTGNFYFEGHLQFFQIPNQGTDNIGFLFKYNGNTIFGYEFTSGADSGLYSNVRIVIPPYTQVTLIANNYSSTSGRDAGAIMAGRIYRG